MTPLGKLLPIADLRRRLMRPGDHRALVEQSLARAAAPAAAHAFVGAPAIERAQRAADAADALLAAGRPLPPLAGLPVSIKDLFDIEGETTAAGSALLADAPPAARDAPPVARLRAAGAALIGRTQMSEFAFSGVGINPHQGTPRNPADAAVARIPGGSSSGAAVSVALGIAAAGLGSDTGGSLRIPAALCGLVGFKPTQARVPRDGAFPLSLTLDSIGAITASVADAIAIDGVIADAPLRPEARPLAGLRFALPQTLVLDALEPAVARAFDAALQRLSAAGARIEAVKLAELAEIAQINTPGGFSAVEAWATHREAMQSQRQRFDPRVAARIALGEGVSAADYLRMVVRRRDWIRRVTGQLEGYDSIICPTLPITAPPIAELQASDEAFFRANGLLLRNTFAINFFDGCAFSLPCPVEAGALPVGLMLAAPAGHDEHLAGIALAVEAALAR
jgi:aspartyl-tRNA(Asn)/glutamyl-tRNA(Gln) amidotransferase subunit A